MTSLLVYRYDVILEFFVKEMVEVSITCLDFEFFGLEFFKFHAKQIPGVGSYESSDGV